jgi:hypothetical protein
MATRPCSDLSCHVSLCCLITRSSVYNRIIFMLCYFMECWLGIFEGREWLVSMQIEMYWCSSAVKWLTAVRTPRDDAAAGQRIVTLAASFELTAPPSPGNFLRKWSGCDVKVESHGDVRLLSSVVYRHMCNWGTATHSSHFCQFYVWFSSCTLLLLLWLLLLLLLFTEPG